MVFYCYTHGYTGVLEAGYRLQCFIERNHWIWCTQLSLRSFLDHWDGRRMEIKCAPWNFLRKSFSIGMCCKLGARCTLVINMNLLLRDSSTTFGCKHEWWICFISEENNRFYARTWQMLQRCCTCPGICIVSCRILPAGACLAPHPQLCITSQVSVDSVQAH